MAHDVLGAQPDSALSLDWVRPFVTAAFPGVQLLEAQRLSDGFTNVTIRVRISSDPGQVVLRIYRHGPAVCEKELGLIRHLKDLVPVPEIIHAEPVGSENRPPFVMMGYQEGMTFRELRRGGDAGAVAEAARAVGEALAAIQRVERTKLDAATDFFETLDRSLASRNLQQRLPLKLRDGIRAATRDQARQIAAEQSKRTLVHGDFNRRNVLVRKVDDRWTVAAILDWEYAYAGGPLTDIGSFLRYDRASSSTPAAPGFAEGYLRSGGTLPAGWRRLARLVDLGALCWSLTEKSLPNDVESEVVELIRATVEDRDAEFQAT